MPTFSKLRARRHQLRVVMLPDGSAKTIAGDGSWRDEYDAYLLSGAWQHVRRRRIRFDNYRCADCGWRGDGYNGLQVHHLSYARLKHEDMADLVTLCNACHEKRHLPALPIG